MAYELLLMANAKTPREREREITSAIAKTHPAACVRLRQFEFATLAIVDTGGADGDAVVEREGEGEFALVLAASFGGAKAALEGRRVSHECGAEAAHLRVTLSKRGPFLAVANDGLGLIRLFWAAPRPEEFCAASSLSLVRSALPAVKINEGAAAEYLLAEQVYGSKTLFCNLFRLEPGSILEWSPNGTTLSVNSLLTYRSDYSELGEDVDKWARAFEEVWHDVMADLAGRANGRIIVGLSSGLDSRTIAGGLRQIDQPFTAFTYGSITSAEVRVAASVSSVLDAPHVLIPYGPGTILHRPDFCHANLDDGLSAVNATEGWFCDALPLIGRTFVTGYGGDALWGNDRLWGVRGIEQVRQLLVQRLGGRSGQIAPLVEPEFARKLIALIRGAVEESTAGLTSMNRPDTGLLWLLQNRVVGFGWNFVSVIRRMGLQYENPFFTSKMLKYSLSMPPSVRAHGRAYLRVHRDYFPATAQFARNINGAIPARDTNYLYLSGFARAAQQIAGMAVNSPRYAARRLGSIALSRLASRLARVGYTEFGDRLVRNQSPFAHDFAARELPYYRDRLAALIEQARDVGCPLLSRAGLTDALDALRAGRVPAPPIVLGRVAALAAWTAGHA